MDIILLESLNKLGKAGEIVTVKDGFAKNFLIPGKKAIIANKKNRADLENRITQINSDNEDNNATWTAPDIMGEYSISCTVNDQFDGIDIFTIDITVQW